MFDLTKLISEKINALKTSVNLKNKTEPFEAFQDVPWLGINLSDQTETIDLENFRLPLIFRSGSKKYLSVGFTGDPYGQHPDGKWNSAKMPVMMGVKGVLNFSVRADFVLLDEAVEMKFKALLKIGELEEHKKEFIKSEPVFEFLRDPRKSFERFEEDSMIEAVGYQSSFLE